LFMVTAATNLFILVVLLVLWPFIWALSKLPTESLQEKLKSALKEYKYNLFLRYWIQCYLDLALACLIQLATLPEPDTLGVINYLSACLVGFLVLATPSALYLFNRKYKTQITYLGEESLFHLTWGTLFYEFKHKASFAASHAYFAFTSMRLLLAGSLVLLGNYPYFQAGTNTAAVLGYTLFSLLVKPQSETTQQVVSIFNELAVFGIFGLVVFFLNEDWKSSYIEDAIFYIVLGVVFVQTAASIFGLGYRVYSWMQNRRRTRVVVLERDHNREIIRDQVDITEVTNTGYPQKPNPLDFFRRKSSNT